MSCKCGGGCSPKKGAAACEPYPEYRDTEVLGGNFFPGIAVFPLTLIDGAEQPVSSLSDVRRTMLVDVTEGVLYMWFRDLAGAPRVGGDNPHMTFGVQSEPAQVILPPGMIRLVFGAGGGSAAAGCVTLLDRDPHEKD